MSKWLKNKEKLFSQFKEQKKQENEKQSAGPRRSDIVWKTPDRGTQEKPKVYQLRLLPDKQGNFYKSYYYHMFKNNQNKWMFVLCPKTHGFDNYCPFCSATMKLYQGNKEDKRTAYNYKRKRKHCTNVFVVKDPRDAENSEDEQSGGKVFIYEFPDQVESKIKEEMLDEEYGNGIGIFDPGKDGVDFILKVGATKPIQEEGPNKGKSFHEYSDSKFSNKSAPIASTDDEIEQIMESAHDLDEYLGTMDRGQDELVEMVKDEMLWDLISSDFPKQETTKRNPSKSEDMDEMPSDFGKEESPEETKEEDSSESEEDISDDDLLKELDGI